MIVLFSNLLFGIISRDFTNKIIAKIFSRYNRNRAKTEVIWDLAGLCRRVFCFPSFLWVVFVIAFYIIMQNMSKTVYKHLLLRPYYFEQHQYPVLSFIWLILKTNIFLDFPSDKNALRFLKGGHLCLQIWFEN